MITISVDNKPLYIPADTTITFEQSSNLLGDDGICADIAWSFEIPAEPNQRILGTVQYTTSSGNRHYNCEIAVDGIPISRGELYIQSTASENRLTCGFVANSFGIGFGNRLLRDNDYGPDIVISQTEEGHKDAWRQFLLDSLSSNIYRFFLFYDSKFYKDNEDYGFYNGTTSPLEENDNEKLANGYVNRLFWEVVGMQIGPHGRPAGIVSNLIEDPDTAKRGCRIFNTRKIKGKQNGYCFAPALRLDWLVRKVIDNATLNPTGTFFESSTIQKLYSQSLCAMDGNSTQYDKENMLALSGIRNARTDGNGQSFVCDDTGEASANSFYNSKPVTLCANYSLHLDRSTLHTETYSVIDGYDEDDNPIYGYHEDKDVFAIMVCPKSGYSLPRYRMKVEVPNGGDPFIYGSMKSIADITAQAEQGLLIHDLRWRLMQYVRNGWMKVLFWREIAGVVYNDNFVRQVTPLTPANCYFLQLTPNRSYPMENEPVSEYVRGERKIPNTFTSSIELSGNTYRPMHNINSELCIRLVKFKVHSVKGRLDITPESGNNYYVKAEDYGGLEELSDFVLLDNVSIGLYDPSLNIFSRLLEWRKHVPNLSNGEFLDTVCKAFGLSLFTNPMTRQLQLNFFTDTLNGSFIDISEWVSSKERMEYSPKKYEVTMSPLLGSNNTREEYILPEVLTKNETPSALMNAGKHIFVKNEAAFRGSNIDEKETSFTWPQEAGDSRPLVAGAQSADESEEVSVEIGIPNMSDPDEFSGIDTSGKYICQVEHEGCSPLMDKEYNGEFPLVLMQDRGVGTLSGGLGGVRYAAANPTHYKADGGIDTAAISTSAAGDNSIGEKWLRPLYNLLGNCDRYRLTAHLPSWAFFKVMATLQPQDGNPSNQVRYIQCDGLRILPVKINSELSGRASIVCTIEGITPHFDI